MHPHRPPMGFAMPGPPPGHAPPMVLAPSLFFPPGALPPLPMPLAACAWAPPGGAVPPAGAVLDRACTLYVGKIPEWLDDGTVRRMLDACGHVVSWKRPSDPENGRPKAFGLCEYRSGAHALRALRVLGPFALRDGATLLVRARSIAPRPAREPPASTLIAAAHAAAAHARPLRMRATRSPRAGQGGGQDAAIPRQA